MKVGTEDRKKVVALAVVMAIALLLLLRVLFESSPTAQADSGAAPAPAAADGKPGTKLLSSEDPSLRLDLLAASHDLKYKGSGRDIFKSMPEPPPLPPKIPNPACPWAGATLKGPCPPPPPPPPPPIPLKFFGFASGPGEPKAVFLSEGDDVFIAHEGEVVDRHYKIQRIGTNTVTIIDVLTNHQEDIPLTQS